MTRMFHKAAEYSACLFYQQPHLVVEAGHGLGGLPDITLAHMPGGQLETPVIHADQSEASPEVT